MNSSFPPHGNKVLTSHLTKPSVALGAIGPQVFLLRPLLEPPPGVQPRPAPRVRTFGLVDHVEAVVHLAPDVHRVLNACFIW